MKIGGDSSTESLAQVTKMAEAATESRKEASVSKESRLLIFEKEKNM